MKYADLKMALKESLAVLQVLREANLSCQLKCTWQGKPPEELWLVLWQRGSKHILGDTSGHCWKSHSSLTLWSQACVKTYWVSNSLCEGSQYILLCKFCWFSYDTDERAGVYPRGDWSTCGRCLGSAEQSLLTHSCKISEVYSACICCWEERSNSSGDFSIL